MAIVASPARPVRPSSAPEPSTRRVDLLPGTTPPGPFRWTRERYEKAVDAGVLTTDDRVELLDGLILNQMSQNEAHAVVTSVVAAVLRSGAGPETHVREEKPIALSGSSEPEPDVAVVRGGVREFLRQHPEPSALILLVEVAETSLARDRTVKAALYAEAGVPEYWIVNLVDRTVEAHRDPAAGVYRTKTTHGADGSIAPLHAPEASIPVADLLP